MFDILSHSACGLEVDVQTQGERPGGRIGAIVHADEIAGLEVGGFRRVTGVVAVEN